MNHRQAKVSEPSETPTFLARTSKEQVLGYVYDLVSELQEMCKAKNLKAMSKILSLARYEAKRQLERLTE
jgi:predicted ATPase